MAGGPDAVAAAAADHVADGDGIGAVRLCEMALAADADHRGSLEIFLAAHELLLAEHEAEPPERVNFWLVGWLRHQIASTRDRLGVET
jgi:hypothetical protein